MSSIKNRFWNKSYIPCFTLIIIPNLWESGQMLPQPSIHFLCFHYNTLNYLIRTSNYTCCFCFWVDWMPKSTITDLSTRCKCIHFYSMWQRVCLFFDYTSVLESWFAFFFVLNQGSFFLFKMQKLLFLFHYCPPVI